MVMIMDMDMCMNIPTKLHDEKTAPHGGQRSQSQHQPRRGLRQKRSLTSRFTNRPRTNRGDFLLADTRRTDCKGGTVRGAITLPAYTFYPTRKTLYDLCKQAGIKKVIFYYGSSQGRSPRCAAWFRDYVNHAGGVQESKVMAGGIRGWVKAYGGRMMDGYDDKAWEVEER
ncbi:hypothetical protein VTH82DRAFT_6015 [Thermothelomyces myriococcoides]